MKESFGLTLSNYWSNGLNTSWTILIPLLILVYFIILSIILSLLLSKSKNTVIVRSLTSIYYSGIITCTSTLLVIIYLMQFTSFFGENFYQMGFIIGLILIAIFIIIPYKRIYSFCKGSNSNALGLPVTSITKRDRIRKLKHHCWLLWLWTLLLVSPFLLLLIPSTNHHLISIVLDNSGSMDENLHQCTQALEAALLPTRQNADYIFTTIDYTKNNTIDQKATTEVKNAIAQNIITTEQDAWLDYANRYFNEIVKQNIASNLATNTSTYNEVQSLFNSFAQMGVAQSGSPVYEGIWQNYLTSKELASVNNYDSKKLIVITDGADNLYWILSKTNKRQLHKDIFQQTDNNGQTADNFYSSICTIDYGDNSGDLLFLDCTNSIDESYNGTNEHAYFEAFRSILPEMYFDILFLYILIGYVALLMIVLFIIKSTKS